MIIYHIFLAVYSSLHGFIWNPHIDQLPVGLLVERCTSITEVMSSKPIQAWIFLGLFFTTAEVVYITARITFIFTSLSTVQIYNFHIFLASNNNDNNNNNSSDNNKESEIYLNVSNTKINKGRVSIQVRWPNWPEFIPVYFNIKL